MKIETEKLGKGLGRTAYKAATEDQIAVIAFGMVPMDLFTPFIKKAYEMIAEKCPGEEIAEYDKREIERHFAIGLLEAAQEAKKLMV